MKKTGINKVLILARDSRDKIATMPDDEKSKMIENLGALSSGERAVFSDLTLKAQAAGILTEAEMRTITITLDNWENSRLEIRLAVMSTLAELAQSASAAREAKTGTEHSADSSGPNSYIR